MSILPSKSRFPQADHHQSLAICDPVVLGALCVVQEASNTWQTPPSWRQLLSPHASYDSGDFVKGTEKNPQQGRCYLAPSARPQNVPVPAKWRQKSGSRYMRCM